MAAYRLTADADADFADIYGYSIRQFGEVQADKYISQLIDAFELLVQNPHAGTDRSTILHGARCLHHRSHAIYYWIDGDSIAILRILHQSQDPMRHV